MNISCSLFLCCSLDGQICCAAMDMTKMRKVRPAGVEVVPWIICPQCSLHHKHFLAIVGLIGVFDRWTAFLECSSYCESVRMELSDTWCA